MSPLEKGNSCVWSEDIMFAEWLGKEVTNDVIWALPLASTERKRVEMVRGDSRIFLLWQNKFEHWERGSVGPGQASGDSYFKEVVSTFSECSGCLVQLQNGHREDVPGAAESTHGGSKGGALGKRKPSSSSTCWSVALSVGQLDKGKGRDNLYR
jgi:hypothetical protein